MTDLTQLTFDRDSWGHLTLTLADGRTFAGVEPVRCFPLSDPEKAIALLDAEGHEILTLPDLDSLPHQSRETLKSELASRDFVPVIQRVVSTTNPAPPACGSSRQIEGGQVFSWKVKMTSVSWDRTE